MPEALRVHSSMRSIQAADHLSCLAGGAMTERLGLIWIMVSAPNYNVYCTTTNQLNQWRTLRPHSSVESSVFFVCYRNEANTWCAGIPSLQPSRAQLCRSQSCTECELGSQPMSLLDQAVDLDPSPKFTIPES